MVESPQLIPELDVLREVLLALRAGFTYQHSRELISARNT